MNWKRFSRLVLVPVLFTLAVGAGIAVLSPLNRASADDKGSPTNERAVGKTSSALLAPVPNAPIAATTRMDLAPIPVNPAFDRFVDLTLVRHAWEALAPELLTDVALQLAEAERVLRRTHKSGITADHLLGLAAKLAAEKKDPASLKRLVKTAESRGDKSLATAITMALTLVGEARAVEPALTVSIDRVDPEAVARFQQYQKALQSGRVLGSVETLDALEKQLPKEIALPEVQRTYLASALKDAKASLRQGSKPTADPLKKLLGPSRDFWSQFDIFHPGNAPQIVNPNDSGLSFRNSTSKPIWVAVHFFVSNSGQLADGTDLGPATNTWFVKGWWMVQPGYTYRIFNGLTNRFYYWYANSDNAEWAGPGDHNLWVHPAGFTYRSDDPQEVNGIRQQGGNLRRFNTLNTGDYSAYMINLR